MGVALVVLGLTGTAPAQNPYLPNQGQPGVMPEPIPFNAPTAGLPAHPPGAVGVPAPPQSCPPGEDHGGPPELRGDLPNAWTTDVPTSPPAVYFGTGYLGLKRQRLGHQTAAYFDSASGGVDTGNAPPAGARDILNFHDINPRYDSGVLFTLGYHWDTSAVELSGFYLGQSSSSKLVVFPGSLDAPFNVNGALLNAPLGFEGDNGLWLQADIMRIRLQQSLASGEANYRWWLGTDSNFSWTLGVRYLNIYERFSFFTGDDDLEFPMANGLPDPTRQATYSTTVKNQIVAPQVGCEWNVALNCWLAYSMTAKAAAGPNFLEVDTLLKRGDGLVGFAGHRANTIFSEVFEFGFFLDFSLMENCRLRAGYDLLWAADVADSTGQLDYNLAQPNGRRHDHGSILYGGPLVELSLLF
jgi:hypothetical protein